MCIHTHTHSTIYLHIHSTHIIHFRQPVITGTYLSPQSTKQKVRYVNETKEQKNRLNAGMSLMQTMTPAVCRFNGHVGGTQTSAFIVFIDGAKFVSLTPSAPSPSQGLKRTLHSSTNKLNKSRLVKQTKREPEETENRHADTPSPV